MPELTKEGKHWLLQDGEIISIDNRNKLILEKSEVEEIDRRLKQYDIWKNEGCFNCGYIGINENKSEVEEIDRRLKALDKIEDVIVDMHNLNLLSSEFVFKVVDIVSKLEG